MLTLTDFAVDQIYQLGQRRSPREAVGLIAKGRVLELPNRSMNADRQFSVDIADIKILFDVNDMVMHQHDWEELVLWHTHPKGSIGPSRSDMLNKHPELLHLVVSLTNQGPVATFY